MEMLTVTITRNNDFTVNKYVALGVRQLCLVVNVSRFLGDQIVKEIRLFER